MGLDDMIGYSGEGVVVICVFLMFSSSIPSLLYETGEPNPCDIG